MTARDPRSTRRYRQLRAVFLANAQATGQPCWICQSNDPPPDTPDHLIPVSLRLPYIDPLDTRLWRPAHQACNNRRQAKLAPQWPFPTSRKW
jgi:hypothetical protein